MVPAYCEHVSCLRAWLYISLFIELLCGLEQFQASGETGQIVQIRIVLMLNSGRWAGRVMNGS